MITHDCLHCTKIVKRIYEHRDRARKYWLKCCIDGREHAPNHECKYDWEDIAFKSVKVKEV